MMAVTSEVSDRVSGFQRWLHIRITWGVFKMDQCLGPTPDQVRETPGWSPGLEGFQ